MVSMKHEGLLELFRNRPTLAPELLQRALGMEVPAYTEARVEPAEFNKVVPTEYRADLVVLLVVAPDEAIARWCAQPIPLGHPGFVLRPLVLGRCCRPWPTVAMKRCLQPR